MFRSPVCRKLFLGAAAVALLGVAGCKSQDAASQQPTQSAPAAQQAKASPAPAKPAPVKAPAKPAVANSSKPAAANKKAAPKPTAVAAKSKEPVQLISVTVPKGTAITATVGQTLASDKNHSGDSFAAVLSAPIKVDGKVVLPKGAHVTGRIVAVRKHELKVTLTSVVVHGKSYDLATNSLRPADKDQHKNNAGGAEADASNQKQKADNATLSAKTRLTFKLAKPVTVSVKG